MAGESTPQGAGVILVMLFSGLGLILAPLFLITPERFEGLMEVEHTTYRVMLGETMVNRILDQADELYSGHTTAPDIGEGGSASDYFLTRLEVLDLYLYLTCYRLAYLLKWDFLALLLLIGFAVDGQMRRKAKMWDFSFVSPMARKISQTFTVIAAFFVPLAFLAPVPLTPLALPLALLLLGLAMRSMSATMQKRS